MEFFAHIFNHTIYCDMYAAPGFVSAGHGPDSFHAVALLHRTAQVDIVGPAGTAAEVGDPQARAVAGVPQSLTDHVIVRKPEVVWGNLDWESSRGNSTNESEWIVYSPMLPIPTRNDFGQHNATDNTCPLPSEALQGCDAFREASCCSADETDHVMQTMDSVESFTFPTLDSRMPAYPREETGMGECAAQMQQLTCGLPCSQAQGQFASPRDSLASLSSGHGGFRFDGPALDLHLDFRVCDSLCERLQSSCGTANFTDQNLTAREFCSATSSRADLTFGDRAMLDYQPNAACYGGGLWLTEDSVANSTNFGILLRSEPGYGYEVTVTVVPDQVYLGEFLGWRDCLTVEPSTAVFGSTNWSTPARFDVESVQNRIDQGLFTNCGVQFRATSPDDDYTKGFGPDFIEIAVSDDEIAGILVNNTHAPTCINTHHASCETQEQYTMALNEVRAGYVEDTRPYSTSWREHWKGGLIATKHNITVERDVGGGFIVTTTTNDGVVVNVTNVTDPDYVVYYHFNETLNATVQNATEDPEPVIIDQTIWHTYEDSVCEPLDSFDPALQGRMFSDDIANHTVATAAECGELCLRNDTCRSFDFRADDGLCSLGSSRLGEDGVLTTDFDFVHHKRLLPGCIPDAARCGLYNITLDTQPVAVVTVIPVSDHQIVVSPAQQPIDPREWTVPVTFEVCVVDDFVDLGLHSSVISHDVVSDDPYYHQIALHNLTIDITDDDFAGVTSYCSNWCCLEAYEGFNATEFLMTLDSEPAAPVNVSVVVEPAIRPQWWGSSPVGDSVTATPFLAWTPYGEPPTYINGTNITNSSGTNGTEWHASLPVSVHADDDLVVEGPHFTSLTISIRSDDPKYNFTFVPSCQVRIHDNDVEGLNVGPSNLTVLEGGDSARLLLSLQTQPVHEVVLNLSASNGIFPVFSRSVVLDSSVLRFNSSDWDVSKFVYMTALEDDTMDCSGVFDSTLHAYISSDDPTYDMGGVRETVYDGYTMYGVAETNTSWIYTAANQTSIIITDNDVAQLQPDWVRQLSLVSASLRGLPCRVALAALPHVRLCCVPCSVPVSVGISHLVTL